MDLWQLDFLLLSYPRTQSFPPKLVTHTESLGVGQLPTIKAEC